MKILVLNSLIICALLGASMADTTTEKRTNPGPRPLNWIAYQGSSSYEGVGWSKYQSTVAVSGLLSAPPKWYGCNLNKNPLCPPSFTQLVYQLPTHTGLDAYVLIANTGTTIAYQGKDKLQIYPGIPSPTAWVSVSGVEYDTSAAGRKSLTTTPAFRTRGSTPTYKVRGDGVKLGSFATLSGAPVPSKWTDIATLGSSQRKMPGTGREIFIVPCNLRTPCRVDVSSNKVSVYDLRSRNSRVFLSGVSYLRSPPKRNFVRLGGGWPAYNRGYQVPVARKEGTIVRLHGLFRRSGSSVGASSLVAKLPVGYRPAKRIIVAVAAGISGRVSRLDIMSNGDIHVSGSRPSWISVSGVVFGVGNLSRPTYYKPSGTKYVPQKPITPAGSKWKAWSGDFFSGPGITLGANAETQLTGGMEQKYFDNTPFGWYNGPLSTSLPRSPVGSIHLAGTVSGTRVVRIRDGAATIIHVGEHELRGAGCSLSGISFFRSNAGFSALPLSSGNVRYSKGYYSPSSKRIGNRVALRGVVAQTKVLATKSKPFALISRALPVASADRQIYLAATREGRNYVRVDVTGRNLYVRSGSTKHRWVSLDDISYFSSNTGTVALKGNSGTRNYGGSYGAARARKNNGFVFLSGLVRIAKETNNQLLGVLPPSMRPKKRQLFFAATSRGVGRIDVYPDGSVRKRFDGSTWISLANVKFATAPAKGLLGAPTSSYRSSVTATDASISSSSMSPAIVGAVVGGIAAVMIAAVMILIVVRRNRISKEDTLEAPLLLSHSREETDLY